MTKRLVAKVGTYEKDGQTKGEYVEIGVILSNENGEFAILDPTVNLAGVMMKQRLLNKKGDSVMCGIYSNDNQQQGQQQNAPRGTQQGQQQRPQQQAPAQQQPAPGFDDFDDDIPF